MVEPVVQLENKSEITYLFVVGKSDLLQSSFQK